MVLGGCVFVVKCGALRGKLKEGVSRHTQYRLAPKVSYTPYLLRESKGEKTSSSRRDLWQNKKTSAGCHGLNSIT